MAGGWPDSRRGLFGRLGLPDATAASTFAAGRLASRRAQLSGAEQAEVIGQLGWAAGELIPRAGARVIRVRSREAPAAASTTR